MPGAGSVAGAASDLLSRLESELVSDPLVVCLVLRATGTAPLAAPADCAALRAG